MNPHLKSVLKSLGKDAGKGAWRHIKKSPKLLLTLIILSIPLILISIFFLPILIVIGATYYLMKFFRGKDVIINENVSVKRGKVEDSFDKKKLAEGAIDVVFEKK